MSEKLEEKVSSKLEEKTKAKASEDKTLSTYEIMKADDILSGGDKLRAVAVAIPEWKAGSQVFVAELSADERDAFETAWVEHKQSRGEEDNIGFRAFTVAWCICTEGRYRTFAGREAEAAAAIGQRNGKATSRLFNTISRINGLTKADIDQLEGN
jgi:hypothetical protein